MVDPDFAYRIFLSKAQNALQFCKNGCVSYINAINIGQIQRFIETRWIPDA